jgi:hypothetical protein
VAGEVERAGALPRGLNGEPQEFVFRDISWTRDELAEFEIWHAFGARDLDMSVVLIQRRARRIAFVALIGIVVLAGGLVVGVEINSPLVVQGVLMCSLPLLFVLISKLRLLIRGRKGIRRWVVGGVVTRPARLAAVRVTPEGVTTISDAETTFVPWSKYAKVEVTALLVVCRTYEGQYGAMPRRIIGGGEEFGRIHGTILTWFREGGGGRAEPTIERLRDHDAPCKRCGYNLRGIDKLICPECGRELDLVDL